ncbi:M15 family metallopeptidase [Brevibacillus agri]|uniref:M15 family metallopeptidase n=1 Tax=Brevibacillus agri TaxID=51101 RepID=UPI0025B67F05|nr:M15 family metallopeptidase [Brevibacillus agri]MDN4094304.1 M15 family metallopeptidase [Brevibacillus agri]
MKKNRTNGLAIVAALSVALLSGCEAPSLDGLLASHQPSQPTGNTATAKDGTQTNTTEPAQGESPRAKQASLAETIQDVNGVPTVTNPTDLAVVVNKKRALPADYIPPDLVEPDVPFPFDEKVEKRLMRQEAAQALEELFAAAKQDGIELYAVSGYRSYKTQKSLYETYVRTQGAEHAAAYSAVPGKSEHQTGLAMDVSGADAKTRLEESFGEMPEGKWLAEHCAEYGFIIRYLKGREDTTGYAYEPWHLRYVGKEMAREITAAGLTLEDYLSATATAQK